ncbi:hypothetical protein M4J06_007215, partial [Streptomyces coelicoflavus]
MPPGFCVVESAGCPQFLTRVHDQQGTPLQRHEDGQFLAKAEFNSGLHYYHHNGKPGPGVNSTHILDRCGDGLIPRVTWTENTRTCVATLTDECLLPRFPYRTHTVKTGYAPEIMEETTWYVSLVDANGELQYTGDAYLDDWMRSYSHDTGSEFFVHSSVYRDEFGTTGQDTVIASIVPTTEAYGRVGSVVDAQATGLPSAVRHTGADRRPHVGSGGRAPEHPVGGGARPEQGPGPRMQLGFHRDRLPTVLP